MIRLRERPGTPEFFAEYQRAKDVAATSRSKAELDRLPAAATSLRWLVLEYYKSTEFRLLGPSTQKARQGILDNICESKARGTFPFALMDDEDVCKIRDEKIDLPEAANGRLKALRQMFAFAIKKKLTKTDPTVGVGWIPTASEGYHTWTVDEVRAYEQRHPIGTKARLAMSLLLFTGVRRSDVVKLGPQMEKDGTLFFTETKGSKSRAPRRGKAPPKPKKRALPILPELREAIDAAPSGQMVYLVTAYKKPFTAAGFGNRFRDWCDEAGLNHCSAHGLRKAGATIAADNGATAHQLMAIYGWVTLRQAELYTKDANRTRLAGEAMHLLVPRDRNK